jgi:glycosyltransferase involved in cell wall biosynthesis
MSPQADTVVFIPALNEEESLPGVLDELRGELPGVDVLVLDDGSRDRTAELAREWGAEVLSFPENRGLPVVVAAGYEYAARKHYAYCGRVDADGQHPAAELHRLLERVRSGECDVAVGSRFVSGDGYEPYRYKPSPARRLGTSVLRRALRLQLGRPMRQAGCTRQPPPPSRSSRSPIRRALPRFRASCDSPTRASWSKRFP